MPAFVPVIKRIALFLTESQLWVSLAALSMFRSFYLFSNKSVFDVAYGFMVFGATWMIYIVHRSNWLQLDIKSKKSGHFGMLLFLSGLTTTIISSLFVKLSFISWSLLLIPMILSINYLAVSRIRLSVKRHFLLKPIAIAGTWVWVCGLPFVIEGAVGVAEIALFFSLIFALAVLFDIKDLQKDLSVGLQTIANRYGEKNARILASVSLALCTILWIIYGIETPFEMVFPILFLIISYVTVYHTRLQSGVLYYGIVLDGLILLFWFLAEIQLGVSAFL